MNRLSLSYDGHFIWLLGGDAIGPARTFNSLPEAVACARELTGAAEALIELRVGGFSACIHQEQGWPRRIHAPERVAA
jgi:hypothetical protein